MKQMHILIDNTTDNSNEAQAETSDEQEPSDNQSEDNGSAEESQPDAATGNVDYKSEYTKMLAPLKAAKREIKLDNIDDARRLMQMGVDYSRKMEEMKPYRRILKTLEKADLVDIDKINFLIDLSNKDHSAVKKFLKDSEIDPIDLELEDDSDYTPTDHTVSDNEIALNDVLDEIRNTPSFDRTIEVVSNEWDSASKQLLMDNPGVIQHINEHIGTGIYDQIANRVATERALGRLNGLSDLEAYKTVGDAMYDNGEFGSPNSTSTSPSGNTSQASSHPNGSNTDVRARKRAASPTKGNAGVGKKVPDFSKMTDEQIEKFDLNSL